VRKHSKKGAEVDGIKREVAGSVPAINPWGWMHHDWDEMTQENVAFTLRMLEMSIQWAQRNNIRVLVTSVPHWPQYPRASGLKPEWSARPHQEISSLVKQLGVAHLDSYAKLYPSISGSPQTQYYYRRDMHFNPLGYRLWADAHLEILRDRKNNLLPESYWTLPD
jgi:lysophospholipase L1-like esterase